MSAANGSANGSSWTARARERAVGALPPGKLLPDRQPAYMASWICVFGVLSLASLVVLIASGSVLSLKGPAWWHVAGIGHFVNSIHLWSVELFFFFTVIHLWGKYWMAAWRGGRARVWMTGAVTFLVAIPCALTGYISQPNFDAQWISTQAKDGMNAAGIGAFFNVTDFGQMYSYHVLLLPLAVVALVVAHVLLVRAHGIVPPFALRDSPSTAAPVPQLHTVPRSAPTSSPAPTRRHRPVPVPPPASAPAPARGHGSPPAPARPKLEVVP